MKLLISSNYNISDEKWSIVACCNSKTKAITLERITKIKYFPKWAFFWKKNYFKLFIFWLNKIIKEFPIEKINNIYILNFPIKLEKIFPNKNIYYYNFYDHHLLHAYSTFYPSNFKKSAILIIDWAWYEKSKWKEICYSIRKHNWNNIENLFYWEIDKKNLKLWIWYIYALHILLLKMWEWSIMWLSSYWNKNKYKKIDLFWRNYLLKNKYIKYFKEFKIQNFETIEKSLKKIYKIKKNNLKFNDLKHIAARLQFLVEEVIISLAKEAKKLTWYNNLCIAWWVWLNILANTKILDKKIFKNIFVQPACDDSWLSLWWIYYLNKKIENKEKINLKSYWLWEIFSNKKIEKILKEYNIYIKYKKVKDIYKETTKLLIKKKIIWWFQWWSEFWPRALWFRSILARSDSLSIRNKINKIKKREHWRPIAPMIIEEKLNDYFHTSLPSAYMLFNAKIKKKNFPKMIGVSHSDFSARYQTVNKKNNPYIYKLLSKFYKESSIPILINTSLNQRNEPIIETPNDAIKMFIATELDNLIIWDFIVSKKKKDEKLAFAREDSYSKLFNEDKNKLKEIKDIISKNINLKLENKYKNWKIIFKGKNIKFSISLIENNIIWNKKKILLNFETIKEIMKEKIIKNLENNINKIWLILLYYYNDFIYTDDITGIIINNNNLEL